MADLQPVLWLQDLLFISQDFLSLTLTSIHYKCIKWSKRSQLAGKYNFLAIGNDLKLQNVIPLSCISLYCLAKKYMAYN